MNIRDYWDWNDPAASEKRFRELLLTETDPSRVAEINAQIARSYGLRGEFDAAHAILDSIEPNLPHLNDRANASYTIERGRVLRSSGKPTEARPLFDTVAQSPVADLQIDALHMIAFVTDPGEAERVNLEALALAEKATDEQARAWRGTLLNNLGWDHHTAGDYETALGFFERCLEARLEHRVPDRVDVAKWCLARCLRSLERYEEALQMQLDLALTTTDAFAHEEAGENLLALGRPDEAKGWFAQALALVQAEPQPDAERIARLTALAG